MEEVHISRVGEEGDNNNNCNNLNNRKKSECVYAFFDDGLFFVGSSFSPLLTESLACFRAGMGAGKPPLYALRL